MFYDQLKSVNEIYADIKHYRKMGETEKALKLAEKNKDKLKRRRILNRTRRELQKLNARLKVIQKSERDSMWK